MKKRIYAAPRFTWYVVGLEWGFLTHSPYDTMIGNSFKDPNASIEDDSDDQDWWQ